MCLPYFNFNSFMILVDIYHISVPHIPNYSPFPSHDVSLVKLFFFRSCFLKGPIPFTGNRTFGTIFK